MVLGKKTALKETFVRFNYAKFITKTCKKNHGLFKVIK